MQIKKVALIEGSGPNINAELWHLIEVIDGIETKEVEEVVMSRANTGGMVACVSPVLKVEGKEVAQGYKEIKSYLLNLKNGGSAVAPDSACNPATGTTGLIPVTAT